MVTVLIHPQAFYLKGDTIERRRNALTRRLQECEDAIVVLPKPGYVPLVKGATTVYDNWRDRKHAKRGAGEIARIVDKDERIILGGFMRQSCVYTYARELHKFHHYDVTIKENLTDAALWHVHDTATYPSYEWLIQMGVKIDPPPVKRKWFMAYGRTYSKGPANEKSKCFKSRREAIAAARSAEFKDQDGSGVSDEIFLTSGLKLG
jgi:hypothetical protein